MTGSRTGNDVDRTFAEKAIVVTIGVAIALGIVTVSVCALLVFALLLQSAR